jgi:phosphorylase kinase alpha/beta subunit
MTDFIFQGHAMTAPVTADKPSPLPQAQNPDIAKLMRIDYTPQDLKALQDYFTEKGTLALKIKPNGLYGAVTTEAAHLASGYSYTWVRDTVAVSVYQMETGRHDIAVKTVRTLQQYFARHSRRFADIIAGTADKNDAMQRPHIRFNGDTLEEIDQQWGHAQNDALGYALWLACRLAREGHYKPDAAALATWALFPPYFNAVEYWQDEDNGHWEEAQKVESSSIGAAMAGLTELSYYMAEQNIDRLDAAGNAVSADLLEELIAKGRAQLDGFLPWETRKGLKGERRADSATLFLIYPLAAIEGAQADKVLETVLGELSGPYGIKRYPGDSYWCANYKKMMTVTEMTADFSGTQEERDRLLIPGTEAQWCIFDPVVSVIYGKRFLESYKPEDLQRQIYHFNRALAQITPEGKCPEAYYMADSATGDYVPNDQTPLAWTQANLGIALAYMQRTRGN